MCKRLFNMLSSLPVALIMLTGCDGMFSDIYDNDKISDNPASAEFGFVEINKDNNTGKIYVDATSYQRWNYLDFHTLAADTTNIVSSEPEPSHWDIALHRYDVKTNGGRCGVTGYTSIADVALLTQMPDCEMAADVWTTDRVTVDMSHMMEGYLVYTDSYLNEVLSSWVNVDTSEMPPIYTKSDKVYLVELNDGSHAALKLTNFMNGAGVKGYMTIEYAYPLKF